MSEYGDLISATFGKANPALPAVVGNISEDPDKAQRALDLAKATGVPGSAIYGDLDEFERQTKATVASDIVANNPHLGDFVQQGPLHAKIANDDWGTLDSISQKVSALALPFQAAGGRIAQGFMHGFGEAPLGGALLPANETLGPEHRLAESVARGIVSIPELVIRPIMGAIFAGAYGIAGEEHGEKLGEVLTDPGLQATLMGMGPPGAAAAGLLSVLGKAHPALPFLRNGREPPPTILPEFDKMKAEQNATDLDALKEATSDAQQSALRERNPELFKQFIAQHTDAEIRISGEAVSALYGDKLPTGDDNILGWAPKIADQLELARATGADVSIPLADWLAHAEPELMTALHDDIRVRPGGITANEVKLGAEADAARGGPQPPPLPDAVASIRAASALEPMFSVGDRKLTLARKTDAEKTYKPDSVLGPDELHMLDEKGTRVGSIEITSFDGGKKLYVDMVTGVNGLGPRDFGPALMRSMLRQLKELYPQAENIGGYRVSGAREAADSMRDVWIKFDNPKGWDTVETANEFRRILEGGEWKSFSRSTQAYFKPYAERRAEDRQITDAVKTLLNRVVPRKLHFSDAVERMESRGAAGNESQTIEPTGIYIRYKDIYPTILVSLEGPDPVGSAAHESIHHLRNYGFFKPEEWSVLEREAAQGDWIKKHGIDSRYAEGNRELKLEEAIAEEFADWRRDPENRAISPELRDIFTRLKELYDMIRAKIGEFLGKEPSVEDIFQRVETGQVGSREGTEPIRDAGKVFNDRSQAPKERIIGPAAKLGDQIFRGITHPFAAEEALKTLGKTLDDIDTVPELHAEGFLTDKGRYLTREEAYKLGRETGQIGDTANKYMHGRESLDTIDLEMAKVYEKEAQRDEPPDMAQMPPEPEGGPRVFERAAALGMTVDQFRAYDKLITRRHAEDIAAATERATKEKAREQTKQWKEDRKALRVEVADDIKQRPDVAADLFFGAGELYGKKVPLGSVKLDASALTEAQKAGLPRNYYGDHGLHPDDVANLFGYGSGDALVGRLVEYNVSKLQAGMSARDFVSRVTDIETDRQMRIRHGVLEDNILDAVKEQVAGETQLNVLAEETHFFGMKSGKGTLDKATIVSELKEKFAKMPMGSVSSDAYLRAAGKAGRAAEMAHLNEDWATAFQHKQTQWYATVIANEAAKLEKDVSRFDKTAKRFSKREVPSVDQEYTNFIHDILQRVGRPVRRSVQDLEGEIAAGEYKSLQEFTEGKNSFYLREVAVADILFDAGFRKKFEDLTVDEFRAVDTSIKSLIANGRDEKKITKAGVAEDLDVVRGQMLNQLAKFQEKEFDAKGERAMGLLPGKQAAVLRGFGIDHLQMESIFNRWDSGDPNGVFQQYVMRDLVVAANSESAKRKVYADRLMQLRGEKVDLNRLVDNTIFKVPGTDQVMKLNRGNLRAILLNAGNRSNLDKMVKGYGLKAEEVQGWLHRYATPEDWQWAQKVGDIFSDLKKDADVMYRNLSGVAAESIPLEPIQTPHGELPGWYYPLIAHPEFEGKGTSKALIGKAGLEEEGFIRATTANGYTKARTGAVYPLALDLDMMPYRIGQMIHDIEMRPAVINASKIFYDKDIRGAIATRFGNEWRDMLVPYLRDVANSANYMAKNQKRLAQVSEFIRQNMITTLVGLNPGTFLKHTPTALVQSIQEVGVDRFLRAMRGMWTVNEATGESNWKFAMRESEELQRRHTHFQETLGGAGDQLIPQKGYASLRSTVNYYASAPVAMGDLSSAVPTWLAQYTKSLEEGATGGDAVYMADRAVRRAHGSTAITNRSAVMRGGYSPWLASVYGFFNHIMNRQYEMVWKSGETLDLIKSGEDKVQAMREVKGRTAELWAYVLAPAIIEELVSPLSNDEHESWGVKAAKGLTFTLGASWIGVRDLANAVLHGRDPALGLSSTALKSVTDVFRDVTKDKPLSKAHAGKLVKDGSVLLGAATGLVPAQVGKAAQFGMGVATGQERPKGPWGWMTGVRFGTLDKHPKTFDEWQRHHTGGH